ncbi:MAG: glutathione S-transferase [Rhodospirillaceae bacterium]|nr:glutathione S-transferase [Rhodospirillaceae bacterium]|tara:strand:+ start:480 stop:1079 length:600 start_codon:yes stop_codon:yes gene_type:complete
MLKLYDNRLSGNGYKTRLLMHQLGMPFEVEWVDILKGETRTPEFLAINPNGRIPTLVDSDYILPESNAILCYLADGTPFLPDNRQVKGRILQWLFFEQYSHEPNIATVRHWLAHLGYDADDPQVLERQTKGEMVLNLMNEHLSVQPFFVGGDYTIADIALYAYTHVAHEGGYDLSNRPALKAWLDRVANQPGYVTMDAD